VTQKEFVICLHRFIYKSN